MVANSNCLEGARCPDCGQDHAFHVVAMAVFTVQDDGTDEGRNVEWESDSPAYCSECQWSGSWGDLTAAPAVECDAAR